MAQIRVLPGRISSNLDCMATQVQAVIGKYFSPHAVHTPLPKEEMSQLLINAFLRTSIAALSRDRCNKEAE